MASLYLFSADDARSKRWPSGTGSSHELALWPGGCSLTALDFTVRVTLDRIERLGTLPSLPGYEHVVVPLGASGLQLSHSHDAHDTHLRGGEAGSFQGAWSTAVSAMGAPTSLLSICTRTGRGRATVQTVRLGQREIREAQVSPMGLLYVARGSLTARTTNEENPFELNAGDGIFVADGSAGDEWAFAGETPDAQLVWAQIETP